MMADNNIEPGGDSIPIVAGLRMTIGGILWQPLTVQAICPGVCRRADVADFLLAAEIAIPTGASKPLVAVQRVARSAPMATIVSRRVI
jgi:hypothetical protein